MANISHGEAKRWPTGMIGALAGWLALAASYYFALPIYDLISLFSWLLIAVCWLWAVIASVIAVVSLLKHQSWRHAAAVAVLATAAGIGMWSADWLTIYLKSQLWLHQAELGRMAAEHRAGPLSAGGQLPWQLRYLSIDGHAHQQPGPGALYLPMWQNWRGEAGGGLVYLTAPPGQNTWIETAPGGRGRPSQYVGGDWWWVEGG